MAFTMDNIISDGDIEIIVRKDSALDVTDEQYAEYLENLDESKLKLKEGHEPTRFVMRKAIPFKHLNDIENSKIKYSKTGEVELQLGFILKEVRATLKDIKNPPSVPKDKCIEFKQTGDGLVDEKLMAGLAGADIVTNLYTARKNYVDTLGGTSAKK